MYDEYVDEKKSAKLSDKTCQPWESMKDLLIVMDMELGRQFALRGGKELTYLLWAYLKLDYYEFGEMKGLWYVKAAPEGGFDKGHQCTLQNPTISTMHPIVIENPSNDNCIVKLILFYRKT